ncbi:hypothetical protein SDC9_172049 [bioreactor metagenome]|uniref:Uncharacterized protein n=1 Tax=bioreactor metagenome TaxID=1076179 RepID=A0A645GCL7_9ZZZZ
MRLHGDGVCRTDFGAKAASLAFKRAHGEILYGIKGTVGLAQPTAGAKIPVDYGFFKARIICLSRGRQVGYDQMQVWCVHIAVGEGFAVTQCNKSARYGSFSGAALATQN